MRPPALWLRRSEPWPRFRRSCWRNRIRKSVASVVKSGHWIIPRRSLPNSRDSHHAPCLPSFCAVGEQQLRVTVGAEGGGFDTLLRHTGGQQLLAVRLHQIEEYLLRQLAVSGSAGGEK